MSTIIKLKVCDKQFQSTKETLQRIPYFNDLFEHSPDKSDFTDLLIPIEPKLFGKILNHYRAPEYPLPDENKSAISFLGIIPDPPKKDFLVKLNVGGEIFIQYASVFEDAKYISAMINRWTDKTGITGVMDLTDNFIDRDPVLFKDLIHCLKYNEFSPHLAPEFDYFNIDYEYFFDFEPLSEKELADSLVYAELRFSKEILSQDIMPMDRFSNFIRTMVKSEQRYIPNDTHVKSKTITFEKDCIKLQIQDKECFLMYTLGSKTFSKYVCTQPITLNGSQLIVDPSVTKAHTLLVQLKKTDKVLKFYDMHAPRPVVTISNHTFDGDEMTPFYEDSPTRAGVPYPRNCLLPQQTIEQADVPTSSETETKSLPFYELIFTEHNEICTQKQTVRTTEATIKLEFVEYEKAEWQIPTDLPQCTGASYYPIPITIEIEKDIVISGGIFGKTSLIIKTNNPAKTKTTFRYTTESIGNIVGLCQSFTPHLNITETGVIFVRCGIENESVYCYLLPTTETKTNYETLIY
jgi:hypothetical protein